MTTMARIATAVGLFLVSVSGCYGFSPATGATRVGTPATTLTVSAGEPVHHHVGYKCLRPASLQLTATNGSEDVADSEDRAIGGTVGDTCLRWTKLIGSAMLVSSFAIFPAFADEIGIEKEAPIFITGEAVEVSCPLTLEKQYLVWPMFVVIVVADLIESSQYRCLGLELTVSLTLFVYRYARSVDLSALVSRRRFERSRTTTTRPQSTSVSRQS